MRATICLLSCLLMSPVVCADPDDLGGDRRYLSFDDGEGLYGSSVQFRYNSRHSELQRYAGTQVSQFFIGREYGFSALHYGGLVSEDEHQYYGGFSLGPATLAYIQGKGESFSKAPNPLYEDLNQYYFHGGTYSPFEIQGVGADISLGGGISTQLAFSTVTAPAVEDRHSYYAGATGRRFSAGLFQVDRGGDTVGQGLDLGYSGRGLDLHYQQIRSGYGAALRRVAFEWKATPRRSFSLELEQAHNDLFPDGDEQRVMLRFRKRLGPQRAFSAAESGDSDGGENAGQKGFGRAVAIGVGAGVAAIALSSGSGGHDKARRFAVRNDAAFDVMNDINPVSVRQNREHGGWIYRNADNTFGYTDPVAGTVNSVNIGNPGETVPQGTSASASYHTHGGPDPRYDNEHFSPQDILSDRIAGTDGYLGTPAGFMKLHHVRSGAVTVVGRINN